MTTLVWPSEAISTTVLETLAGPGGPFELREEEAPGTRMLAFANRPRSIIQLLHGAAARMGDKPYVIFPDREYTFASILQPIAAVAAALRDKYGVGPGDRVAIVAPNTIEYALAFWATVVLGGVTVGLNGWWTGEEIAYAVELTEPKVLLGDRRRLERLEGVDLPDDLPVLSFEDDFAALEAYAPDAPFPEVELDEDDPFVILFTSGTTGRPKGVMLSHRNNIHFLLASMLNGTAAAMTDAEQGIPMPTPPAQSVIISAAPMFHIAGSIASSWRRPSWARRSCTPRRASGRRRRISSSARSTARPLGRWYRRSSGASSTSPTSTATTRRRCATWAAASAVWPPELLRTLQERIPTARRHRARVLHQRGLERLLAARVREVAV